MKSAVIVFPGSNCDRDLAVALEQITGRKANMVWHKEPELPEGTDFIGIPGGFSYGDYLRSGRDGRALAGHAGGQGRGSTRRSRDRHLQRLPGADRSRVAARRTDAERTAELRLPRGAASRREQPEPVHGELRDR